MYQYGLPILLYADQGSTFNAGFSWLREVLDSVEINDYFSQLNVKTPSFRQYPRGSLNRGIGGIIESSVKLIKRLIQGSIRNNVLSYESFLGIIKMCICYANKRPLTNQSALRDQNIDTLFNIVTPEILKLGYETCVLEVNTPIGDYGDWSEDDLVSPHIAYKDLGKVIKIKHRIRNNYHTDFLYGLLDQATRQKDKYKQVMHHRLAVGDIVVIKDPLVKAPNFPLGVITKVTYNSNDESTICQVYKANRSTIVRDSSSLILLVEGEPSSNLNPDENVPSSGVTVPVAHIEPLQFRTRRQAAVDCDTALRAYFA